MDNIRVLAAVLSILQSLLVLYNSYKLLKRRRWWVRPANLSRNKLGFHRTCLEQLVQIDEKDLLKGIRMDVTSYQLLLSLLKESLTRYSQRKPIDPNMRLSLTLFYLAQGCSFKMLALAYKMGVSTVSLLSELRSVIGSLRLSDWFNRPGIIEVGDNFDSLTRGHATQPEELTDINFDREIKHFLFRRNMPFGSDLRAIDIQRNRDHGLASYNDMREFCGLRRAHSWEDFADLIDQQIIEKLKTLYESHDDVDLTVGGSLESHVAGALAGPTFLCILTEQFYRTRVGDRFFYENGDKLTGFTPEQLAEIRKASMARLLCDNGIHIASMQPHAFLTISKSNPVVPCSEIPQVDLTKWIDQKGFAATPPLHYGK